MFTTVVYLWPDEVLSLLARYLTRERGWSGLVSLDGCGTLTFCVQMTYGNYTVGVLDETPGPHYSITTLTVKDNTQVMWLRCSVNF